MGNNIQNTQNTMAIGKEAITILNLIKSNGSLSALEGAMYFMAGSDLGYQIAKAEFKAKAEPA